MTTAAEHQGPRAATTDGQLPTVLADTVERILAAVLGGWPTIHQPGPPPEPTDEEP